MKKFLPIAAIAVVACMFTSCKKDYTCTCSWTQPGASTKTTQSWTYPKTTKSKATDACNSQGTIIKAASADGSCSI